MAFAEDLRSVDLIALAFSHLVFEGLQLNPA